MTMHRRERVEHLLRAELADLLLREARDPRLRSVVVSGVRMTADLRQARVFFRLIDDPPDPRAAQAALARATPFLRGAVARSLGLRVTPELQFEYDRTPDTARRVDELLHQTTRSEPEDDGT